MKKSKIYGIVRTLLRKNFVSCGNRGECMKKKFKKYQNNVILTIGVILVAIIAFGAGRLSLVRESKPIVIRDGENVIQASAEGVFNGGEADNKNSEIKINSSDDNIVNINSPAKAQKTSAYSLKDLEKYPGMFVASKSSTKYHWPWCSWAKRIKPENQVWYKNEAEAKADGKTKCSYFEDNAPWDYKEP